MTAKLIAYIFAGIFSVGGGGYVAKVVGDTWWVPIQSYQQEKLYDLEDEAESYTDRESLGEVLTPLDELDRKRLLKRIERLQDEIN
jgi:hypothetical protein